MASKCATPNCMFYGNPKFCSKCFVSTSEISTSVETSPSVETSDSKSSDLSKKYCSQIGCKKRLKINSFEANNACVCSNYYCLDHKQPDVHACSFNYKVTNKAYLAAANKKIEFVKVSEI